MPRIIVFCSWLRRGLVTDSPRIARGWFHFDHLSAKVGQDYCGARTSDEACQIYYFQSGKNVVSRHYISLISVPPAVAGGCHFKIHVSEFIGPTRYRRWY